MVVCQNKNIKIIAKLRYSSVEPEVKPQHEKIVWVTEQSVALVEKLIHFPTVDADVSTIVPPEES